MLFKGNYCVRDKADISTALEALKGRPLYAEKWAKFRMVSSTTSQAIQVLSGSLTLLSRN
jgi:hypothetical protein